MDVGCALVFGHQFLDFCIATFDFAFMVGGGDVAVVVEGVKEGIDGALA